MVERSYRYCLSICILE